MLELSRRGYMNSEFLLAAGKMYSLHPREDELFPRSILSSSADFGRHGKGWAEWVFAPRGSTLQEEKVHEP